MAAQREKERERKNEERERERVREIKDCLLQKILLQFRHLTVDLCRSLAGKFGNISFQAKLTRFWISYCIVIFSSANLFCLFSINLGWINIFILRKISSKRVAQRGDPVKQKQSKSCINKVIQKFTLDY